MEARWWERLPGAAKVKEAADWLTAFFDSEVVRRTLQLIFQLAVAVVFGILVAILMFKTVTMQENSMEPTIETGDCFFVDSFAYRVGDPQRGDLIVFKTSSSDDAALHISRIIGLPGETVRISNGRIYIDEELYMENAGFPAIKNPGLAASGVSLNSGEYFVLGDNRNNSEDSRYSDIGKVMKRYIVGKLWFQLYPRNQMGFV